MPGTELHNGENAIMSRNFNIQIYQDGRYYYTDLNHPELKVYKRIRALHIDEVEQKATHQWEQWEDKRHEQKARELARIGKAKEREAKAEQIRLANELAKNETTACRKRIDELQSILAATLSVNDAIDWNTLQDNSEFTKQCPNIAKSAVMPPYVRYPDKPVKPKMPILPPAPCASEKQYQPKITFADRLNPGAVQKKKIAARTLYACDYSKWNATKEAINQTYTKQNNHYRMLLNDWEKQVKSIDAQAQAEYNARLAKADNEWREANKRAKENWEKERAAFKLEQTKRNAIVKQNRHLYLECHKDAVEMYCKLVLERSDYPACLSKKAFNLTYNPESRILDVEYQLPLPDDLPSVKEVKYVQSRDSFEEVSLPSAQVNALYDSVLYQITLRTIHELCEADVAQAIDSIVFNGWITFTDKSTGHKATSCLLSLHVSKTSFAEINLAEVDPKACFKQLKGVGSAKLYGLVPVAPILQLNKEDKRFVSSYEVAQQLDEGTNLAAMSWEDFEHLIREVFELEFSGNGGEVKVTQASRDGGVDAVAFDPDPIRGGKIVIQAKRYTNVVGVSAVRDLYGTVMSEGATKGILVTTSDYGSDAYEFINGKPLTLLNGSHLLHLLEKHGHKARINLNEAKQLQQAEA